MAVAAVWPLSRPCVPRARITDHATSTGVGVRETEGRCQEAELRGRCVGGGWNPRPCAGGARRRTCSHQADGEGHGHPEIPSHLVPSRLQMRSRPGTRASPGTVPPHSWPGWRDPYASSYPPCPLWSVAGLGFTACVPDAPRPPEEAPGSCCAPSLGTSCALAVTL